ncbi:class I mannose-6-phosphate isomerase [Enterococcus faecium]|uniref:class I mannose-6-phosphate isomerase n=1 Tax=Enterococcus faecium TaxID=1352 RepID=UPI002152CC49|nr:class I mannose-6-phosphate isomerase [Enterococcus faecium]
MKKDLSVQVHPTDEYATEKENGQLGKTEIWYVLYASLIYGLQTTTEETVIREAIAQETVERYLQKVTVKKDDVLFIEVGTIHAIGAGALIAEIQENSNLTYRLYDYDRVDKNGKKRELHVDKALEFDNLNGISEPKQPLRVLKYRACVASELLCRCKYFEVYRMIISIERRQSVHYRADFASFRVLLCVNGCGTARFDNESLDIYKGDCLFVPADFTEISIHGSIRFLDIRG